MAYLLRQQFGLALVVHQRFGHFKLQNQFGSDQFTRTPVKSGVHAEAEWIPAIAGMTECVTRSVSIRLLLQLAGDFHHVRTIGRASCRARVCRYVSISAVAVPLHKKHTSI